MDTVQKLEEQLLECDLCHGKGMTPSNETCPKCGGGGIYTYLDGNFASIHIPMYIKIKERMAKTDTSKPVYWYVIIITFILLSFLFLVFA